MTTTTKPRRIWAEQEIESGPAQRGNDGRDTVQVPQDAHGRPHTHLKCADVRHRQPDIHHARGCHVAQPCDGEVERIEVRHRLPSAGAAHPDVEHATQNLPDEHESRLHERVVELHTLVAMQRMVLLIH